MASANTPEDNIFNEISDAAEQQPTRAHSDGDAPRKPSLSQPEGLDLTPNAEEDDVAEDTGPHPDVTALVAERDELKDRLIRALAEAENIRKRGERDRREAEQYGGSKLARDLLPVYDNMRRALDSADEVSKESAKAVLDGVELTMRELLNIFSKHGMTLISPENGDPFDPQKHQAMFEAPVPNVAKGCIIQVMAEGFMLHDRLLRPAHVGVASAS